MAKARPEETKRLAAEIKEIAESTNPYGLDKQQLEEVYEVIDAYLDNAYGRLGQRYLVAKINDKFGTEMSRSNFETLLLKRKIARKGVKTK